VKSLLVRARIGLVEAVEARDTACAEIRGNLADAFDRGVRASGLARRHLRDCPGCVEYRAQLRAVRDGFSALSPGPGPLGAVLKLVGVGGAGSAGAASAGGGAAAGGSVIAAAGTGTAAKVAAVVCCAALTAGGAVEVGSHIQPSSRPAGAQHHAAPAAAQAAAAPMRHAATATATRSPARRASATAGHSGSAVATRGTSGATTALGTGTTGSLALEDTEDGDAVTGGAAAPNEETGFGHGVDGLTPVTAAKPEQPAAPSSTSAPAAGTGYAAPPAESTAVTAPAPEPAKKVEFVPPAGG
jgi:hypothetical protein